LDCQKQLSSKSSLKSHINSIHNGIKMKCPICNLSYSSENKFRNHKERIHKENIQLKIFACQDCFNQFTEKAHLNRHIKRALKGIKFKCEQCDKDFVSKET